METKTIDPNREFNAGDELIINSDHKTPGRENLVFPLQNGDKVKAESVFVEPTGHVHINIGCSIPIHEPPLKSLDTGEPLGNSRIYWMHPSRFTKPIKK
jgi:hypothetical protein